MSLADRIEKTIAKEMRALGLVNDPVAPLPTDLDAEGELLSGVLSGDLACADFPGLASQHFYSSINGAVWAAARDCAPGDLVAIATCLVSRGWSGAFEDYIAQLAFAQPWRSLPRLREQASRVIELAKRRDLIGRLQRLEADLRSDRMTVTQAAAQLREVFK